MEPNSPDYWAAAVDDVRLFNQAYAKVIRNPRDEKLLRTNKAGDADEARSVIGEYVAAAQAALESAHKGVKRVVLVPTFGGAGAFDRDTGEIWAGMREARD